MMINWQSAKNIVVSPKIDLSRSAILLKIFQFRRDTGFNLNVWVGKNDGSWNPIWDLEQGNNEGNSSVRSVS